MRCCLVVSCIGPGSLLLFSSLHGFFCFCSIIWRLFWSWCSRCHASLLGCLMYRFWILCHFSACFVAFFIFVQLYNVLSGLNVYGIVRCYSIVLCIRSGFFVASELILWFSFFNYTTSLLVSVFIALSLVSVLLCMITSVLVWLHAVSSGFYVSAKYIFLITWRHFSFRYLRHCLWSQYCCSVCLPHLYTSFYILSDHSNGIEFFGCVFPTYTSHQIFNSIVSLLLQSIICVNCFSSTLLSRKCREASLLSSSPSEIEYSYPAGRITSSGFIPVNSMLRSFGTESLCPIVCRKMAGDKWKMTAKEVARNGTYNLPR